MTENRRFLLEDIKAMMHPDTSFEWMESVSDDGLYHLWQDLVNLTLTEDLT